MTAGEALTPQGSSQVALVTGASSGFGRAIVELLASQGYRVAFGARRFDLCEQIAQALTARGFVARPYRLDVTDMSSIAEFVDGARNDLGEVDVVISNAGSSNPLPTNGPPERFASHIGVNLLGAQAVVHHTLDSMVERQQGRLVFITSEMAVRPRPQVAGYLASKAGLEAYVRGLQLELEGTGVSATIVRPGPALTEQGSDWQMSEAIPIVRAWEHFGLIRHDGYMTAQHVAQVVGSVLSMPAGAYISEVEVQPVAPLVESARSNSTLAADDAASKSRST